MKSIAVIPARLHSKRFPKKILFPIQEKPMVVHVYENAKKSELVNDVIIAVDDEETVKELKKWKVKTIMTDINHSSGTDRVNEASSDTDAEVIVNLQADEPFLDPNLIDMLIKEFEDPRIEMATVAGKELNADSINDLNTVKVLLDVERFALAFRRKPLEIESGGYYHHAGIYAYRKDILDKFTKLDLSVNEKKYKLEQLRAIDNGISIKVVLTGKVTKGIDTLEDLRGLDK
jgi:3-deoxy-manno-octulosonate cytidylyltransferase (CMP-KDO synthetase)|tara:strand:+ start:1388 stop:2083 length:696 start_codon:yes stop_codon:yes gene_type:complete